MTGGGKAAAATAVVTRVEQLNREAAEQAASGHITAELAEVLTAVQGWRVVQRGQVPGQWVIDVSWWGRVAVRAGLAAPTTDFDGGVLLKLTDAGRAVLERVAAMQRIAYALHAAQQRQVGAATAGAAAQVARPWWWRPVRLVGEVASAAGWFAAGALALYLVTR